MNSYTVLIADDYDFQRETLKEQLKKFNELKICNLEIVKECSTRLDAISQIQECKPDIVFLDIDFEDGLENTKEAGFEIAMKLHEKNYYSSAIIFFTNWDNEINVTNAFALGGFGFISKSASKESFAILCTEIIRYDRTFSLQGRAYIENNNKLYFKSVKSFIEDLNNEENIINIWGYTSNEPKSRNYPVKVKDILFLNSISTVKNLCCYHLNGGIHEIFEERRFKEALNRLPPKHFKKCTSRDAININYFDAGKCLKKIDSSRTCIMVFKNKFIEVVETRNDSIPYREFLREIGL